MSSVLRGIGLVRTYNKGEKPVQVLRGVDFELEEGEFAAVVGPSGAGKSTLLHLLGALDVPTQGEVHILGERVNFRDDRGTSRIRNQNVGFVFQFHELLPDFTAVENTAIPAMMAGKSFQDVRRKAAGILTDLGLHDRLNHRPSEMSGGEKQRTAVARALINDPGILLLDEPTGNLDRSTGDALFELLLSIREKRSLSVVMVTHNESLAMRVERACLLVDGLIRPRSEDGDPQDRRGIT